MVRKGKVRKQGILLFLGLLSLLCSTFVLKMRSDERPVRLVQVVDGETVAVGNGQVIKLLGVNTALGGVENNELAKEYLKVLLTDKNLWVENDRYGKGLVWLWVGCESSPKIWAVRGEGENPVGCTKGVLANEQIIRMGWSEPYFPNNLDKVKYKERLKAI